VATGTELLMDHELALPVKDLSNRPNHLPGGGGALNAGYTPVDALALVSNLLGQIGLEYGKDFYWRSFEYGRFQGDSVDLNQNLVLTFEDHDAMLSAKLAIESMK